jgi:hypothetical protein
VDAKDGNLRTNSSVVEAKLSRKFHVLHSGSLRFKALSLRCRELEGIGPSRSGLFAHRSDPHVIPIDDVTRPGSVVQVGGPGSCGPPHYKLDRPDELATAAESLLGNRCCGI